MDRILKIIPAQSLAALCIMAVTVLLLALLYAVMPIAALLCVAGVLSVAWFYIGGLSHDADLFGDKGLLPGLPPLPRSWRSLVLPVGTAAAVAILVAMG